MRFPSSHWQVKANVRTYTGEGTCAVCDSKHDLGVGGSLDHPWAVCCRHSKCQGFVIELILNCRERNTQISVDQWFDMRLNSWDRDALIPYMDDHLLVHQTEQTLKNISKFRNPNGPAATYDEALQLYARELTQRLNKGESMAPPNPSTTKTIKGKLLSQETRGDKKLLTIEVNGALFTADAQPQAPHEPVIIILD